MIIKKDDLLKALEVVKPGLASKEGKLEQATSFAFIKNRVVTYNDDLSISYPIEGLDITGAVKAEEMYNLLGKLKTEEIVLSVNENELGIKSGRAKAAFTFQNEVILPLGDMGKKGEWVALPKNFLKGLDFVSKAATRIKDDVLMNTVHVNEGGFVEASDRYRISKYTLDTELKIKTFILPLVCVNVVLKMEPYAIAESKGWVHFKMKNKVVMSCRILDKDIYPDTTPFLKVHGEEFTFPEKLSDMLERAMVFCKREIGIDDVNISINEKRFTVFSKSDSGRFEESIKFRYEGEPLKFNIKPNLLKDILDENLVCTVSNDRIKFSGDNWIYVSILQAKNDFEDLPF